ncbi:cysteine peptidase family C39 domain-containing protein [Anaeromyxobacter soli]|uniref:hypothetical protein n=1 Tax=Anaeromyxobacter soli TaxID=2922725 RepID=UPI001FAFFAE5|nr:hypothetical protein [Anaeromyxobacter sp. SG29]
MFQIIKQTDPAKGCIPACTRSVLSAAGEQAPTEEELIAVMYPPAGWSGSGFAQLSAAFKKLGMKHSVKNEHPLDVAARVRELNRLGIPVLFPARTPNGIHCFVAAGCSENEAVLHNPGNGAKEVYPWAYATAAWTGDIAFIEFGVP